MKGFSPFELELLLDSYCEPNSFYVKGEILRDGSKVSEDNSIPKTWKIVSDSIENLRNANISKLLNFQTIYDIYIFKKNNKEDGVRVRTINNDIYFYQLTSFERLFGLERTEFHLLRGVKISPVFYKKGEFSDYFGRFTQIKVDNKIVATFNLRIEGTIDENYSLYGNQTLKSEYPDNSFLDNKRNSESFEKYNGYNGWSDEAIDDAFNGDPEATWNVD